MVVMQAVVTGIANIVEYSSIMLSAHVEQKQNKQCFSNHLFYFCSKRPQM